MRDEALVEAFVHDEQIVRGERFYRLAIAGVRLRPYSLWHQLLLEAMESPLVTPGATVAPADMQRALAVCQCRYPVSCFTLPVTIRRVWSMLGGGFSRHLERFEAYRKDYISFPDYSIWTPPLSSGEARTPEPDLGPPPGILALFGDVAQFLRSSDPGSVWNMALGEAYWYRAMGQRAQGKSLDFMTAENRREQATFETTHPELHAELLAVSEQLQQEGI